jgi:hypothetical protein
MGYNANGGRTGFEKLLLDQTRVAGDALPLLTVEDPCVGEAAHVVVRFALIGALRMVNAGDDRRVAEKIHLDVLNIGEAWLEERILDVSQEFLLVTDFAVVFGIDEAVRNQGVERGGITIHLGLIPQALQDH